MNIRKSCTFIIDLTKLPHEKDVLRDEFGKWNYSGSHPVPYHVKVHSNGLMDIEKCMPGASEATVVQLRRVHAKHPSNGKFRRMIAFISGIIIKLVLL